MISSSESGNVEISHDFRCVKHHSGRSVLLKIAGKPDAGWLTCEKIVTSILQEGREGGVVIPFLRKLFFSNPSSDLTIPAWGAQIEIPFPFFYCFFHESQSQCTKSHFPASKTGKSQLLFYPFTTLLQKWPGSRNCFSFLTEPGIKAKSSNCKFAILICLSAFSSD